MVSQELKDWSGKNLKYSILINLLQVDSHKSQVVREKSEMLQTKGVFPIDLKPL